jgi:hypothetical protein
MLLVAAIAVGLGFVQRSGQQPTDLRAWLALEVLAGAVAAALAGRVAARVGRGPRAVGALALLTAVLGTLEAAEVLRFVRSGDAMAPTWLVLAAPLVAGAGVLAGGLRRADVRAALPRRLAGRWSSGIPPLILVASAAMALIALPRLERNREQVVLASAVTLDMVVAWPLAVAWFRVRARRIPWSALLPALALGYALAAIVLPTEHQGLLERVRWLAIPLELALVGGLVVLVRRGYREAGAQGGDFATRFRAAAADALGLRLPADVLATEVALLPRRSAGGGARKIQPHPLLRAAQIQRSLAEGRHRPALAV